MYLQATLCETKDTRRSYGLLFLRTYFEHGALDYFSSRVIFEVCDVCVILLKQKVMSSRGQLCIDSLFFKWNQDHGVCNFVIDFDPTKL